MGDLKFSDLLMEFLNKWEAKEGRKTFKELAEYLGYGEVLVNLWINDHKIPSTKHAPNLAEKMNDNRVYDVLGLRRPDKILNYVEDNWDNLQPEQKHHIYEMVEGYMATQGTEHNAEDTTTKQLHT